MLEQIRTIITPTDFSELSEAAVRTSAALARRDDATIHLLHSIRLPFFHTNYDANVPQAIWEGIRKGTRERMAETQRSLELAGLSKIGQIVSESQQPAEAIAKSAQELDADLIVMATHGRRGYKHAFLGSVTERTIRTSPVPVLAVKDDSLIEGTLDRILFSSDFSIHSEEAMKLTCTLANRFGAHVDVVHVLEKLPDYLMYGSGEGLVLENQGRAMAIEALNELGQQLEAKGLSHATHLIEGVTADAISDKADRLGSDVIVMGTHGFSGFAHAVIGSVTERTLRLAPCSVLTTRAPQEHDGRSD